MQPLQSLYCILNHLPVIYNTQCNEIQIWRDDYILSSNNSTPDTEWEHQPQKGGRVGNRKEPLKCFEAGDVVCLLLCHRQSGERWLNHTQDESGDWRQV